MQRRNEKIRKTAQVTVGQLPTLPSPQQETQTQVRAKAVMRASSNPHTRIPGLKQVQVKDEKSENPARSKTSDAGNTALPKIAKIIDDENEIVRPSVRGQKGPAPTLMPLKMPAADEKQQEPEQLDQQMVDGYKKHRQGLKPIQMAQLGPADQRQVANARLKQIKARKEKQGSEKSPERQSESLANGEEGPSSTAPQQQPESEDPANHNETEEKLLDHPVPQSSFDGEMPQVEKMECELLVGQHPLEEQPQQVQNDSPNPEVVPAEQQLALEPQPQLEIIPEQVDPALQGYGDGDE